MAMETSVAAVTVRVVDPETLPNVAPIVVVPALSVDAIPTGVTVPMVVLEDTQVTTLVKFCVLPSE
jgi:hypothetical protein